MLRNWLSSILKSEFRQNALRLFSSTILAQAIALCSTFLLAKYCYAPEAMGLLSLFLAYSNILVQFAPLRYETLIVLPDRLDDSLRLVRLALTLTRVTSLLILIVLILLLLFNSFDNSIFVIAIPCAVLLLATNNIYAALATKNEQIRALAWSRVVQALAILLSQVACYVLFPLHGMLIGNVLGVLLYNIYMYMQLRPVLLQLPNTKQVELQATAREYWPMLRYILPSGMINALYLNLQPILIAMLFGPVQTGLFYFAMRFLQAPLQLISGSISQIFYKKVSDMYLHAPKAIYPFVCKVSLSIGAVVLVPIVLAYFYIDDVITYFFDARWHAAAAYVRVLLLLFLAQSMYNPISYIAEALRKVEVELYFNIYFFIENIVAFLIGYYMGDFMLALRLMALFGAFGYACLLGYFLYFSKRL